MIHEGIFMRNVRRSDKGPIMDQGIPGTSRQQIQKEMETRQRLKRKLTVVVTTVITEEPVDRLASEEVHTGVEVEAAADSDLLDAG